MKCRCQFNNPTATVTAIIPNENGDILCLKRNEDPFIHQWDLPGGYMQAAETPEEAIKRELQEELGCETKVTPLFVLPGTGYWQKDSFPILSHFFLGELQGQIKLNQENSVAKYRPVDSEIVFDSNQAALKKISFIRDLGRMKELVAQLDPSASLNAAKAIVGAITGHVEVVKEGSRLVGMGWIFPRQTLLRKQAVVEDMIVDEVCRGKGYGREILKKLLAWAKDQGVEVVELTTNPSRVAANELYKAEGFVLHPTNHYLYVTQGR